jgi:hypothetical protein
VFTILAIETVEAASVEEDCKIVSIILRPSAKPRCTAVGRKTVQICMSEPDFPARLFNQLTLLIFPKAAKTIVPLPHSAAVGTEPALYSFGMVRRLAGQIDLLSALPVQLHQSVPVRI